MSWLVPGEKVFLLLCQVAASVTVLSPVLPVPVLVPGRAVVSENRRRYL